LKGFNSIEKTLKIKENSSMTQNEVIYNIKLDRKLSEIWASFSREEKEEVLRRVENLNYVELEKVLLEVKTGQNRLF
jgi:hypothetical protein